MKILFIHHSGLLGGAGVSLVNVAKILKEEGHEIIISIPSEPNDMLNKAGEMGLQTIIGERRIGAVTYVSGIDSAFSLRFIYRLLLILKQKRKWNKKIKEINPDVVVVNSKTLCWMSSLKEVKKRKSICFVRETMQGNKNNLVNKYIRKRLDKFTKVSFISNYDLVKEGLKKAKTEVIHNYIDNVDFPGNLEIEEKKKEFNLKKDTFKVLYLGGVNHLKGFHIAVDAVLSMGSSVELIVAGANFDDVKKVGNKAQLSYSNKWQDYILKNDKYNQIHVIGKQSNTAILYSICDVVILPMQSPHQARPIFEAGYFKKPIVISNFDNIKEFVIDGENGFIATYNDYKDFAKKLALLKEDTALIESMGQNNNQNTKNNHNKEIVQQKIANLISEI